MAPQLQKNRVGTNTGELSTIVMKPVQQGW